MSYIVNTEMESEKNSVRIDLWLWSARFFKTRSQAQQAVRGGKVSLNGQRPKPAHGVKTKDRLVISKGEVQYTIDVLALASKRQSPPLAQTLYEETSDSIETRAHHAEERRLMRLSQAKPETRPNKQQRRQLRALTRGK
jgi:ribosome-associated heat shock protein Hsp15